MKLSSFEWKSEYKNETENHSHQMIRTQPRAINKSIANNLRFMCVSMDLLVLNCFLVHSSMKYSTTRHSAYK